MTTTPPPEPSEPAESGPDRPAEREAPQAPQGSEKPADAIREEPVQPPSSPNQPPVSETHPESDQPYSDQRYPSPPPLPPEAYPTYSGGHGYDYGEFGAPPVRRNNNMGTAALVLGIAGFLIGPCSILAIIFGRIGLNRVARGEATNRGVAQAGFVLGIVTLILWILGLILVANQH
jgi:hypothetical protein